MYYVPLTELLSVLVWMTALIAFLFCSASFFLSLVLEYLYLQSFPVWSYPCQELLFDAKSIDTYLIELGEYYRNVGSVLSHLFLFFMTLLPYRKRRF